MASEIHKRRTGKAFRITEEIVMKEEMYEEEDDDFPRSFHLLGPHMRTASADMNNRVETFLSNRVAMSKMLEQDWRDNIVNRTFAATFPNVTPAANSLSQQRWSTPSYQTYSPQQPAQAQAAAESSFDAHFQPINYNQGRTSNTRHYSLPTAVPQTQTNIRDVSPVISTPGSGSNPHTPQMEESLMSNPVSEGSVFSVDGSAFTSELPTEAKMMMIDNMSLGDAGAANLFNQQHWTQEDLSLYGSYSELSKPGKTDDTKQDDVMYADDMNNINDLNDMDPIDWDAPAAATTDKQWDANAPAASDNKLWDSFMVDQPWDPEQQ